MKSKYAILLGLIIPALFFNAACKSQKPNLKPKTELIRVIDDNLQDAARQYKVLAKLTPADRLPRFFQNGKLITSDSKWWCSGFYPGTLLYLYEATGDDTLYVEALKKLKLLEKEQYNKNTHDLGFMMFDSFGNANRIMPKPEYENILINSARSLSTRFSESTGVIRSWNSTPNSFKVIVDNMMNLELLFWATRVTHDSSFYKIAVTHANTTIKNHFRPDNSSYHLVDYNPQTGIPQKKQTVQGYADSSAWARGQVWGLYGYSVMYRETKDQKYLEQANKIAQFIITHPNFPSNGILYWDFNAPEIPDALRDASAAAILASALIELAGYNNGEMAKKYLNTAETILQTLSAPAYKAEDGENGGFLLKHSVGHLPGKSEVDVPLTYTDYYFVEAMLRYKNLKK